MTDPSQRRDDLKHARLIGGRSLGSRGESDCAGLFGLESTLWQPHAGT